MVQMALINLMQNARLQAPHTTMFEFCGRPCARMEHTCLHAVQETGPPSKIGNRATIESQETGPPSKTGKLKINAKIITIEGF